MSLTSIIVHYTITYTLYTLLNWRSKRPLELLHPLLISIYYFLWLMGPFQPSSVTNVTTSIFVSQTPRTFAVINPSIAQLVRYSRTCSSYCNFIDRGRLPTTKLVDQGYTFHILKLYFRKFYSRYNIPFTVFVWPSPLLTCVTLTTFNLTCYDWL